MHSRGGGVNPTSAKMIHSIDWLIVALELIPHSPSGSHHSQDRPNRDTRKITWEHMPKKREEIKKKGTTDKKGRLKMKKRGKDRGIRTIIYIYM